MLAYLFVVIAVAFRLLPHPWHFTPVAASLLYFGARMPRKHAWFPLVLLAAVDVFLNRSTYGYPVTADLLVTWLWYAAMLWLGSSLRGEFKPLRVAGASLASSVSFFVISNFMVWAVWNMYPKTLAGLAACYGAAAPFFRYQPVADLLFSAVLFGVGALVAPAGDRASRQAA
jgi:hypothetical protein